MTTHAEHATVEVIVSGLQTADEQLLRSNAELRLLLDAVAEGFGALNQRSSGRLHELVRQGAEDLAAQIYSILDGNDYQPLAEGAPEPL